MRISERHRYGLASNRIDRAKTANTKMLDDMASLKTIHAVSDNPIGAARSTRLRDRITTNAQHQRNIDLAKGFIERSESALMSLSDNLIRAKELAVNMASDTNNAEARSATAREVKEIIDEVISLGNTQYNNRYIFGGFRTQTPPLDADGNYLGDDGVIYLEIAPSHFRQVSLGGRNLFEVSEEEFAAGHYNLIQAMQSFHHSLLDNDKSGIQNGLKELDFHLEKSTSYHAEVGAISTAFQQTASRLENDADFQKAQLSNIEDADMFKTISDFKRTESILQGTLLASNKVLQPSLLNFM